MSFTVDLGAHVEYVVGALLLTALAVLRRGGREPGGWLLRLRDIWGFKCGRYEGPRPLRRSHQRLPRFGLYHIRVLDCGFWVLYEWRPRCGYTVVGLGLGGRTDTVKVTLPASWSFEVGLKRREGVPSGGVVAALEMPAIFAKRWPGVAEFLVATQFEDGSSRAPGEIRFANRGAGWLVTLYDVEQAARLPVNAPTIEQGLSLMEQLLGVEEAPWEHDQYLQTLLDRRKKKRK